jgi:hypothetical protein
VIHEATDDWYASAKDGSVWYFGEEVKDFETFRGDNPVRAELVSIDGSFKAGRDGDKPGIIALASPKPGDAYLEEFSVGNAEDVTEILSTTYSYGHDAELDENVPRKLAPPATPGRESTRAWFPKRIEYALPCRCSSTRKPSWPGSIRGGSGSPRPRCPCSAGSTASLPSRPGTRPWPERSDPLPARRKALEAR